MPKVCQPRSTPRKKCALCNSLDPRGHVSSSYRDRKKATAHLVLAIDTSRLNRVPNDGCRFCLLLCQALDKCSSGWRRSKQGTSVRLEIEEGQPVLLGFRDEFWQLYAPQSSEKSLPWRGLGVGTEVPSRTDSDLTFDFINKCLMSCLGHEVCSSPSASTYPTRVLDVGSRDEDYIRIHIPDKHRFRYLALSTSLHDLAYTFYC